MDSANHHHGQAFAQHKKWTETALKWWIRHGMQILTDTVIDVIVMLLVLIFSTTRYGDREMGKFHEIMRIAYMMTRQSGNQSSCDDRSIPIAQ